MDKRTSKRVRDGKAANVGAQPRPRDLATPWEFTSLDIAFPTNTVAAMPNYKDVAGFSGRFDGLFDDWFYCGLSSLKVVPKPGIDTQKAIGFYKSLAGYEVADYSGTGRVAAYMLKSAGHTRAAVGMIPADYPQVAPTWLPFLRVENLAETLTKARQLGGKVLLEPVRQMAGGHPLAILADPTGGSVGILEWKSEAQEGAGKP